MASSSSVASLRGGARMSLRPRRSAILSVAVAAAAAAFAAHIGAGLLNFVGLTGSAASQRALRSDVHRVVALRAQDAAPTRDSEGRKIKTPPTFDAAGPDVAATHTAEFKKRPFGIMAYAPSTSGKGAMVWEMNEKSRYPGDPQGQAWVAGVKQGFLVKSVGGVDVSNYEFWDIMDMMDDKIKDNSAGKFQSGGQGTMGNKPAELPVAIEYAELKVDEGEWLGMESTGDKVDMRDARFADLPSDATIKEYRIPKAVPIASEVVEALRGYVASLPEPSSADGPRYKGKASLSGDSIKAMIQDFKVGKLLPLKDAYQLAIDAFDILKKEKTLGRVTVPEGKKVTVVGDLHGQLWDFDFMLGLAGLPSADNQFVFNGDFVDRGPWSVEVVFSLLAFKVWQPDHVFMNRGNHEAEMANHFYGFFGELEVKYEKKMTELFADLFRATPLCHVINNEAFVVHGGIPGPDPRVWWKGIDNQISFDGRNLQISLDEIENSDRFMEPNPNLNPLMVDLLWSDPKGKEGYGPSGRMSSGIYLFGPDVSKNFMVHNKLRMVLRSHEVKAQGFRYDHDGEYPLITIFSAPNYVDKAGNLAAVAVLTNTGSQLQGPEFLQYAAQPHPDVPSGAYAVGGPLHPDGLVEA